MGVSRRVEIGGQQGAGVIQEDFWWPQAQAAPTKTETRNVNARFSHRPFCSTLPSVTKHTTPLNDFLFCSRDIPICYFSVDALQLFSTVIAKKEPRTNQRPQRSLPSVGDQSASRISSTFQPSSTLSLVQSIFAAMKFFESQHEFDYSWEEVSTANWRKYCPWNDKSTHVIAVDTISRHVDPATGIVSRVLHCPICISIANFHISSVPNVSSPANNPHQSGSARSLVARTSRKSTKPRTSTLSPRRSQCAA